MQWYQGGIAEAVAASQAKRAVFLVAIFGADGPSQELETSLNSEEVQSVIGSEDFVCIRLEADSQQHKLFADIYANAKSPSVYCITDKGVPVEIITEALATSDLRDRLQSARTRHREVLGVPKPAAKPAAAAGSSNSSNASPPVVTSTPAVESSGNAGASGSSGNRPPAEAETVDLMSLPIEERIQRARELALARQMKKQKEEEEDHKRREIERREAGKGMAELKRWQDEQEAKKILEERKKDKEDEKALRQRLREQIAQDRAARNARTNAEFLEQSDKTSAVAGTSSGTPISRPSVASSPPPNYSGQARLQFRLPDGSSQTHAFDPDSTLGHVRQFLIDNGTVPFRDFSLWVAFPRRQFTSTEYGTGLRELGLLPSAALLVLPMSGLTHSPGGASSSLWAFIAALLGFVVYPISIVWSYFQRALPSPSPSTGSVAKPGGPSSNNPQGDTTRSNTLGRGNKLGGGSNDNNKSNQPGTSAGLNPTSSSANNDDQARKSKEKGKNSSSSQDGNVHRLRSTESDSDDEKATWNGNSTQQM